MFRAGIEYNMCLFSVVGSDRKLKITPQGQYEAQSLILGAGQYCWSDFYVKRGSGRLDILIVDAGGIETLPHK